MKKTGFLYDERYQLHKTGHYHPEVPDRLACIYRGIQDAGLLPRLVLIEGRPADIKWIELVHDGSYIRRFEAACNSGKSIFDSPDNQMCCDTYAISLLAVGGILDTVDMVMEVRSTRLAIWFAASDNDPVGPNESAVTPIVLDVLSRQDFLAAMAQHLSPQRELVNFLFGLWDIVLCA